MKSTKVNLDKVSGFSSIFLDYIEKKQALEPFYNHFPDLKNFEHLIRQKSPFLQKNRDTLVEVLDSQYRDVRKQHLVEKNIASLKDSNSFTITTGHQLNIFTGPLYFIYKIVTVIRVCQELNQHYPDQHFVPVYWMASEDHDIEEISSFNLFGKKYQWNSEQTGATGKLDPGTLDSVLNDLPEKVDLFRQAYLEHSTLAEAVRYYVNELFGEYGVVVVDADHSKLKSVFKPAIKKELREKASNKQVEAYKLLLNGAGYGDQAFSREINLFYLLDQSRERIVFEEDRYKVLNTTFSFSESEIMTEVEDHPERFSPNVILRPLYQEIILPNLAYVGGPAEIAYWLQLKGVFEEFSCPLPTLMPRNFALVINRSMQRKMDKLGISTKKLFQDSHWLKEDYLRTHGSNGFDLQGEKSELVQLFKRIEEKAAQVDGSLKGFIGAEGAKSFKSLDGITKRLKKAEEQKNETALTQIDSLKEKLFPGGGLQERHENFLNFYLNNPNFIAQLIDNFDPFDFSFHVLNEA